MKHIIYVALALFFMMPTSEHAYPTMIDLTHEDGPFFSNEEENTENTHVEVLSYNDDLFLME